MFTRKPVYKYAFPYIWLPGLNADEDVVDEKTLTETETKKLVNTMMREFFTRGMKERMTREFFRIRHEMTVKENKRVFIRQLENTIVNNEDVFEDMFEPDVTQIA